MRCIANRHTVSCSKAFLIEGQPLNSIFRRRARFWPLACIAVALACPGFGALAVPKAAEHEEGEVSFGEAVGAPPKTGAKAAKPAPRRTAGEDNRWQARTGRWPATVGGQGRDSQEDQLRQPAAGRQARCGCETAGQEQGGEEVTATCVRTKAHCATGKAAAAVDQ
jgi:hypothetical protein